MNTSKYGSWEEVAASHPKDYFSTLEGQNYYVEAYAAFDLPRPVAWSLPSELGPWPDDEDEVALRILSLMPGCSALMMGDYLIGLYCVRPPAEGAEARGQTVLERLQSQGRAQATQGKYWVQWRATNPIVPPIATNKPQTQPVRQFCHRVKLAVVDVTSYKRINDRMQRDLNYLHELENLPPEKRLDKWTEEVALMRYIGGGGGGGWGWGGGGGGGGGGGRCYLQDNMSQDPVFFTPSEIRKGKPVVNPKYGEANPGAARAEEICEAAYRVRRLLFERHEQAYGEPAAMLALNDQTMLLLSAFCDRQNAMAPYVCPELTEALADFRALVPLLPMNAFDQLAKKKVTVSGEDARALLRKYKIPDGKRVSANEPGLEREARALAASGHIDFPEGDSIRASVLAMANALDTAVEQGAPIREIAEGRESRVYLHEQNQTVYKVIPFRMELIHVRPINEEGPIDSTCDHGTYLADHDGGMPLFDRLRLMAQVPGVSRTELLAITAEGTAVMKQPYLGVEEPTDEQIEAWIEENGHAPLEKQPVLEDEDVIDQQPVVGSSPTPGKFFVATDIHPRNARIFNNRVIPFDPVIRELSAIEIASHSGIQAATSEIAHRRTKSVDIDP